MAKAVISFIVVFVIVFVLSGWFLMPHLSPVPDHPVGALDYWTSNWAGALLGIILGGVAASAVVKKQEARQDAMNAPFMEHPAGEFASAVDAMADAITRLRALSEWNDWITFDAQGMGHDEDSYHFAQIRMRRDELQLDESLDVESVTQHAGVPHSSLTEAGGNYSIANASPAEAARIMDAIFRHTLGIRPFPDEKDDYAIGAEWS